MRLLLLLRISLVGLLLPPDVWGQSTLSVETRDDGMLTPARFNDVLLKYHPMARRAELVQQKGAAKVQKARGRFDPKLFSDLSAKEFKGTSYYRIQESGLKIPTWFGIDLKLYHQQNRGTYLNSERTVPSDGLYGVGIELPIGQGLFTDQRRTALNKAKVMQDVQMNKRHQLLMKLLSKGFQDYWKWASLYQRKQLISETVSAARQRFQDVKTAFKGGERTAIDTTEALSQLQQFQVRQRSLRGQYQQQKAKLSSYLWDEDQQPRRIAEEVKPPQLTNFSLETLKGLVDEARNMDSVSSQHPALAQYRNKLELLSLENRLKKEQLKPELDLKYHALQNAGNTTNLAEQKANDDLKWGFSLNFPIFLRKERGGLKLNKLKQRSTELRFEQQRLALQRRLEGSASRLQELYQQIKINKANLGNFERLLEAEQRLYRGGESSLLEVNLRELKYLRAQLKHVKYISQFFKAYSKLRYRYMYQRSLAETANAE